MKKHPSSFPQANLPILFNVVKRCRSATSLMPPETCFDYPTLSGSGPSPPLSLSASASSSSAPSPNPSNPTNNPRESSLLYYNEKTLVVNDPFNKSRYHCLVMPWDTKLRSLNDLNKSHIPLLREMEKVGNIYAKHLKETSMQRDGSVLRTIMGFHAIPSLPMLHLHLISLDLESDKIKKKQHYNSFATYYFLPFEAVLSDIERNSEVSINQDVDALNAMVDGPMRCLWCNLPLANMPEMKRHVPSCPKNLSREQAT